MKQVRDKLYEAEAKLSLYKYAALVLGIFTCAYCVLKVIIG